MRSSAAKNFTVPVFILFDEKFCGKISHYQYLYCLMKSSVVKNFTLPVFTLFDEKLCGQKFHITGIYIV